MATKGIVRGVLCLQNRLFTSRVRAAFSNETGIRSFWGMLNPIFNRYDEKRVKEVGGDRACAEWLIRNGAAVKWERSDRFTNDYNALPPTNMRPKIVEVDASDASISMAGGGFKYFEHTKNITKVRLHKCNYMYDDALYHLVVLAFSLRDLEVSSCANVTDDGILALSNMFDLQKLYLSDLPGVKDREKCVSVLKNYLPKCNIIYEK